MWILLSILTGLLFGAQSVLVKIVSPKLNQALILKYLFLIAGILLLPFALNNPPSINLVPFSASFLISLLINSIAYLLLFTAIKKSPISTVMPYVGFTPLFLTISGYFILGEIVKPIQLSGILLILFGGFILQLPKKTKNKNTSLINRLFKREEKGIYYVIIVAALWSVSASVEKIAVLSSSAEFYGAFIHLALGFIFLLVSKQVQFKTTSKIFKRHDSLLILVIVIGMVSAALAWSQLEAIRLTQVSTVIAFKRAGILITSLFGLFYFKEGNFIKTTLGTLIILAGATLISLF